MNNLKRVREYMPEIPKETPKQFKKEKFINDLSFLFRIQKPHTDWFSHENIMQLEDTSMKKNEIITVKVEQLVIFQQPPIDDDSIKQYLKEFLEEKPIEDGDIEEIQEEEKELNNFNKMTRQDWKEKREELIAKLFQDKFGASQIAEKFGIKSSDVYNIVRRNKNKHKNEKENKQSKRFLITQNMYDSLEEFMCHPKNKFLTLNKIRAYLVQTFNLENRRICLTTVSNMLKRLSFSRKRTKKLANRRNISLTIEKRVKVAKEMITAMMRNVKLIFIDETGFNQSLCSLYGYSKIGEDCLVEGSTKSENYTVIAAITQSKILGYQIFKGGMNAQDFGGFIASMLNKNQDLLKNRHKYIFFMDNAPIHRAKVLKPLFENFQVLFNAPYSPFLNPIEELFGNWKHNFRRKFKMNTIDIIQKILESVQEIDNALLFSSFIHSLTFLKDCLDCKPIV